MRWLWLALLVPLATAVSLETVSINGSSYYWAGVNDSNGNPWVLINASSGDAQWSTAETENITDAISRLYWLRYSIGFGRVAANNTILGVLIPGMDSFNTYGFNSSTEWHMEANKTATLGGGQPVTMRLKHSRNDGDEFVNLTVRYEMGSAGYTTLTDIYFFLKISNITHFDKLNVWQNDTMRDVSIFSSRNFTNVSKLTLHGNQSPPSWTYLFDDSERNIVFVKDGSVWLGYPIGRSLPAYSSFQRSWNSIDAVCASVCTDPEDFLMMFRSFPEDDYTAATNITVGAKWSDALGSCTISSCNLAIGVNKFQPITTACFTANTDTGTPRGSNWFVCTWNNCSEASGSMFKDNPTKNVWYYWLGTLMGEFTNSTSKLQHKIATYLTTPGLNQCSQTSSSTSMSITQGTTPPVRLACTLNGQDIINNSANTIYATNGSTTWANLTVNCTFGNSSTPYGSTGLVNTSYISFNRSGWGTGINQTALLVDYWGKQGITYLQINSTSALKICTGMNRTAINTSTGEGTNWTGYCYLITKLNIIPIPNPPGVKPSIIAQPFWRGQEIDDDELLAIRYDIGYAILILTAVIVFGLTVTHYM